VKVQSFVVKSLLGITLLRAEICFVEFDYEKPELES
jgi:hypothetical protein